MSTRWKHYEAVLRRALEGRGVEAIRREAIAHLAVLRDLLNATTMIETVKERG